MLLTILRRFDVNFGVEHKEQHPANKRNQKKPSRGRPPDSMKSCTRKEEQLSDSLEG